MTKESLLRFTVVLFSGKLIFIVVQGHFYAAVMAERELSKNSF